MMLIFLFFCFWNFKDEKSDEDEKCEEGDKIF